MNVRADGQNIQAEHLTALHQADFDKAADPKESGLLPRSDRGSLKAFETGVSDASVSSHLFGLALVKG